MVLGLSKSKCKICGEKIDSAGQDGAKNAIYRHGKKFCSEDHAEEYRQQLIVEEKSAKKRGGCCG